MTLIKRKDNESKTDFMSRCMSDKVMSLEFEDSEQRAAVCFRLYDEGKELIENKIGKWTDLTPEVDKFESFYKETKRIDELKSTTDNDIFGRLAEIFKRINREKLPDEQKKQYDTITAGLDQ